MENPIIGDDYENTKERARLFYSQIGRIWCPAIGDFVYFGKMGFRHLTQKGKRFRPQSEQKRRFLLLAHVKEILSDPRTHCVDSRDQSNPHVRYWNFAVHKKDKSIKLIVIQIRTGKKYFLSIYAKKQKSTS